MEQNLMQLSRRRFVNLFAVGAASFINFGGVMARSRVKAIAFDGFVIFDPGPSRL
jgi:hypothetical protein